MRRIAYLDHIKCVLLDQLPHESDTRVVRRDLGLDVRNIVVEASSTARARLRCGYIAQGMPELFFGKNAVANEEERVKDCTLFPQELGVWWHRAWENPSDLRRYC